MRILARGLLVGSSAVIDAIGIARGVKQGCPTSGSTWALAFDPLARAASYAALRSGGSLGAFADDLSSAFRDLVLGLQSLVAVLLRMRRAAGLSLNLDRPMW